MRMVRKRTWNLIAFVALLLVTVLIAANDLTDGDLHPWVYPVTITLLVVAGIGIVMIIRRNLQG